MYQTIWPSDLQNISFHLAFLTVESVAWGCRLWPPPAGEHPRSCVRCRCGPPQAGPTAAHHSLYSACNSNATAHFSRHPQSCVRCRCGPPRAGPAATHRSLYSACNSNATAHFSMSAFAILCEMPVWSTSDRSSSNTPLSIQRLQQQRNSSFF